MLSAGGQGSLPAQRMSGLHCLGQCTWALQGCCCLGFSFLQSVLLLLLLLYVCVCARVRAYLCACIWTTREAIPQARIDMLPQNRSGVCIRAECAHLPLLDLPLDAVPLQNGVEEGKGKNQRMC